MNIRDVMAYGTSEGVKKEWDTRGRKSGKEMREDWETRTHNTPGEQGIREAKKQAREEAENIAEGLRSVDKQEDTHGIKKGDWVRDRYGKSHRVIATHGTTIVTDGGDFHSTKVSKVPSLKGKPGDFEKSGFWKGFPKKEK